MTTGAVVTQEQRSEVMLPRVGWLKVIIAIIVCAAAVPARAQNYGGGGGMGNLQFDPAQIRSGLMGRVQYQVGFTDEEWGVIEPRLWRVVGLQAQSGAGAIGALRGIARGRGRGGGGGMNVNDILSQIFNNGKPLPVLERQQALQDAIDDPNSPDSLVATRLREYRQAVQAARAQLDQAQRELQNVLTLRQEAMLMEMGYLQ